MSLSKTNRQVGQGALCRLSFILRSKLTGLPSTPANYRDLAHIFTSQVLLTSDNQSIFNNVSRWLAISSRRLCSLLSEQPSTHIFSCKYRASTHISTVLPHILYRALSLSLRHLAARPTVSRLIPWPLRVLATVLSPTFSPFFQSLCYRALSHVVTVTLPTKFCPSTVLSPTKVATNHLNYHQTQLGKDVFKLCIKKTSRMMMFFILSFFSKRQESSAS